jgi:hypothetical protein
MAMPDLILAKRNLHGVIKMSVHQTCDNCESEFTIKYDRERCEDDPSYCPFCGEMLIEFDTVDDDDE